MNCLLCPKSPQRHESLEQLVLCRVDLLFAEVTRLARRLEFDETGPYRRVVEHLRLRLFLYALSEPHRPPNRRKREKQKPGDQAHSAPPALRSASAKL